MPCKSDYLEPNQKEKESREVERILKFWDIFAQKEKKMLARIEIV